MNPTAENRARGPSAEATADIETASDDYASRFSGAVGRYFLHVQEEIVLRLLREVPGASVLDVGGGHAQLAVPLVREGFSVTVTGSDDVCRERLDRLLPSGGFTYRTCDHLRMPFPDRSFDAVLAFRLLPHVPSWSRLLGEMCRVARQTVIFDYPDRRSANLLYDTLFEFKKRMEGNTRTFLLFRRSEIQRELQRNGFGSIRLEPEFFLPMVLHRKLQIPRLSALCEKLFDGIGLKRWLGSPIVVGATRAEGAAR